MRQEDDGYITTVAEHANGVSSLAVSYKNEKENENMNAFYYEIMGTHSFKYT